MKHFACIIMLLLACLPPIVAQELSDSAFLDAEMEDSISAMAIRPVENPEELLMRALQRLEKDLQYKHSKREYQLEAFFNANTSSPLFASRTFTVEGDDGIDVMNIEHTDMGPWSIKGTYSQNVSADLDFALLYSNSMHLDVKRSKWKYVDISKLFTYFETLEKVYTGILKIYNVTAYCIGDETGRGVYRVHLDEKEPWPLRGFENRKMKWYLDRQSLRLIQINEDKYISERLQRDLFRHDFSEENGAPFLTKSIEIRAYDGVVVRRTSIQLVEK